MIREVSKYKIRKIHPRIFWNECNICKREFKNEDGWRIVYQKCGLKYNICKECAPVKEKVIEFVENGLKYKVRVPIKFENDIKANSNRPGPPPNQCPKRKVEIWIDKGDGSFSFYVEDKNTKGKFELFDIPSMWIEGKYQADVFKKMLEYLGCEILVKYTENED